MYVTRMKTNIESVLPEHIDTSVEYPEHLRYTPDELAQIEVARTAATFDATFEALSPSLLRKRSDREEFVADLDVARRRAAWAASHPVR